MKVTAFKADAYSRGGIAVGSDPDKPNQPGHALDLHFRDTELTGTQKGRHAGFLDDYEAWGPGLDFKWANDTWYWLRLRQTGTDAAGGNQLQGKFWPVDGSVPEPTDWLTWSRPVHSGFAGLVGGSSAGSEGLSEFEVDYVLIKAVGLPQIKVAFSPVGPVTLEFTAIRQEGDSVLLEWRGPGTLQEADQVIGPWKDVVEQKRRQDQPTAPLKFYRLLQQP